MLRAREIRDGLSAVGGSVDELAAHTATAADLHREVLAELRGVREALDELAAAQQEEERPPVRRLVRLHLKHDPRSLEGYLAEVTAEHYHLVNAKLLVSTVREQDVPVDGEAWWPRADVLYVQVIG